MLYPPVGVSFGLVPRMTASSRRFECSTPDHTDSLTDRWMSSSEKVFITKNLYDVTSYTSHDVMHVTPTRGRGGGGKGTYMLGGRRDVEGNVQQEVATNDNIRKTTYIRLITPPFMKHKDDVLTCIFSFWNIGTAREGVVRIQQSPLERIILRLDVYCHNTREKFLNATRGRGGGGDESIIVDETAISFCICVCVV